MMNLFQLQEQLKDFSKDQLVREMQSPSGSAPPFLIMTELQRRTRMENAAALDKGPPTSTVAQDAVNAAGVPQGGIADMARAMAPQTDMTQNTGAMTPQAGVAPQGAAPVQAMQEGGLAGISRDVSDYRAEIDPAVALMAERFDMSPDEYLASLDPEVRAQNLRRIERNRMLAMEPEGDGMAFPTQADLDRRFREPDVTPEMLTERGILRGGVNPSYVESDAVPTYFPDVAINSTMSNGIAGLGVPAESTPYTTPTQRPGSAADYAETRAAVAEGRLSVPSPRSRVAGDLADPIDVSDTTFAAPASAEAPLDRSYQPPTMGATELNSPAMIAALRGPEPTAPSAYRSMDEMTAPEDTRFSDALSRRPGIRNLGERLMDDVRNTAAVLSPFASEEAKSIAAGNLGAKIIPTEDLAGMTPEELLPAAPEAPVLTPEPPVVTTDTPTGTATVGGMPVPPPQTDEDRMLQQDKWLALARFGAALASSQAPTFGQAFGQAAQVGLDALGQARQDFLERKKAADDMAMARATLAARMAGRGDSGSDPQLGLSASAARGLSALDDEIARTQQAMMEAEAAIADSTGIFARPSAEQVQAYNTLRDRAGVLETQRSAITRFGAGLPPSSGVAPPPPIGYDIRD